MPEGCGRDTAAEADDENRSQFHDKELKFRIRRRPRNRFLETVSLPLARRETDATPKML
jgi:hypothetical protein